MLRLLALPLAVVAFHTSIQPLPAPVRAELNGRYWHAGCPVTLSHLRLLTVTHRGFDGRTHVGQLVVRDRAAAPLARVFARLYELRFPIRHMRLADAYGPSSSQPADGDVTASFRMQAGGSVSLQRRDGNRKLVGARLRRGCRPEPRREPVRRVRDDPRQVRAPL